MRGDDLRVVRFAAEIRAFDFITVRKIVLFGTVEVYHAYAAPPRRPTLLGQVLAKKGVRI